MLGRPACVRLLISGARLSSHLLQSCKGADEISPLGHTVEARQCTVNDAGVLSVARVRRKALFALALPVALGLACRR